LEGFGGGQEVCGPAAAGAAAYAVYGAGDGDGGDDGAGRVSDRSRNTGDAGFAFADALSPAAAPYFQEGAFAEEGVGEKGALGGGVGPRGQDFCAAAGGHGEAGADRDGVAKTGRGLGGGHADALHAITTVELDAFAGDVTQAWEDGRGSVQEGIGGAAGQLGQGGAGAPAAVGASP